MFSHICMCQHLMELFAGSGNETQVPLNGIQEYIQQHCYYISMCSYIGDMVCGYGHLIWVSITHTSYHTLFLFPVTW